MNAESSTFKTWAIVEVMGHVEYAGYVSQETIAGAAMLRVDVPDVNGVGAFTKYLSAGALYGITPVSEQTAIERAKSIRAIPFNCWDVEQRIKEKLRSDGLLLEDKSADSLTDDFPF